jgi:hypothetical protein
MNSSPRLARPGLTTARLIAAALTAAALVCIAGVLAFGGSSGASAGPAQTAPRTGAATFIAEGQNIRGTAWYKPACRSGCVLSGDATSILNTMTWRSWTATAATGAGTENIESCVPNCASGGLYRVPVVVTFSRPVKDCPAGTGATRTGPRWFWSKASFSYPHGLPKALRGASAPTNPWIFASVIAQARQSCR